MQKCINIDFSRVAFCAFENVSARAFTAKITQVVAPDGVEQSHRETSSASLAVWETPGSLERQKG